MVVSVPDQIFPIQALDARSKASRGPENTRTEEAGRQEIGLGGDMILRARKSPLQTLEAWLAPAHIGCDLACPLTSLLVCSLRETR